MMIMKPIIVYNYTPKGGWIMVDIYQNAKRRGTYPPLFTDPEGDSCFSIYQIRWTKKCRFINGHNFFFWNFRETRCHFSLRSQNSEYPRIFRVTGANQNARKLLSTDLVNTNDDYDNDIVDNDKEGVIINIILYIQIENVEQELLTSAWDYTETYHN